jgi:hypothetical protein
MAVPTDETPEIYKSLAVTMPTASLAVFVEVTALLAVVVPMPTFVGKETPSPVKLRVLMPLLDVIVSTLISAAMSGSLSPYF